MMFEALLPGLWTAGVGAGLAVALRRWYDPVPLRVWAIFTVSLVILLGPTLLGGKILLPLDNLRGFVPFEHLPPTEPHGNFLQGDLIQLIAPSQQAVRADLLAGRWPLWNPHSGLGSPLLADPQAQPFQPLTLLALPIAWPWAAAVLAALRLLTTLTFTYLFLRRLGCRFDESSFGEGSFREGSFGEGGFGDGGFVEGMGVAPAVMGALAFGFGGYSLLWLGWPLANSATFLPVLLYASARLLPEPGNNQQTRPVAPRRQDVVLFMFALVGLLLAGHPETILYVLALVGTFIAVRALYLTPAQRRVRLSNIALAALVALCITAPVWLPTAHWLPSSARQAHLEAAELAQDNREESSGLEWKRHSTLHWLQMATPNALGNSRYGHYWGLDNSNEDAAGFSGTLTLLLAILALAGLRRGQDAARWQLRLFALWLLMALALVAQPVAVTMWLRELPLIGAVSAHGNRRLWLVIAFCLAVLAAAFLDSWTRGPRRRRTGEPWRLILGAGALAAVIAWAYLTLAHPDQPDLLAPLREGWLHWQLRFLLVGTALLLWAPRRWTGWCIAALVGAELFLAHGDANPAMPQRLAVPWSDSIEAAAQLPPALVHLQRHLEPDERMAALGRALPPNLASLWQINDVRVYNPLEPAAYQRLLDPLVRQPRGTVPELVEADSPLYERLRVRYLLTRHGSPVPAPWRRVVEDPTADLYRLPFRSDCRLIPAPDETSWSVEWPTQSRAMKSHPTQACELAVFQDGGWQAQWRTREGAWQSLDFEASKTSFLPVLVAPPQAHQVRIRYRPPGLWVGGLLAALGWALGFTFFASELTIPVPAGPPTPARAPLLRVEDEE